MMKTVLQHLEECKDESIRKFLFENLDKSKESLMCYSPGYALMLGVNVPKNGKEEWDAACYYMNTGKYLTTY